MTGQPVLIPHHRHDQEQYAMGLRPHRSTGGISWIMVLAQRRTLDAAAMLTEVRQPS